ncbi:MAG: MFS transporter [Parvibaculaceae bacterium]|nr:MFS transporter [Parvibaculaceae bacterium]
MSEIEVAAEAEESLHHPATNVPDAKYPNPFYAWYVVGVLVLAYVFSFLDRQILSLLVDPMKKDLHLTDTQISLLQGLAFALFNTLAGLPIGRLVDTKRRMTIISIGVAFWSIMTACCGIAKSYGQLLIFRMGVGVGESTLTPSAYSVIADYFPPRRLGLALGIYGIGVYIGAGLAFVIGGLVIGALEKMGTTLTLPVVGNIFSWQAVFLVVGLPGLIIALWTLTLREPRRMGFLRKKTGADGIERTEELPLKEVFSYFLANGRSFFGLNLCFAFAAMMAYGVSAWIPTFFIRTHGMTAAQVGHSYGLIIVVFGTLGVISGGIMGDIMSSRFRNGRIMVMSSAGLLTLPFGIAYPLVSSPELAMMLVAPATFFATFTTGVGPSALQEMLPNQMRGMGTAISVLMVNLIGLGLGPTAIAVFTDYVIKDEMLIRYSMAIVPAGCLLLSIVCGLTTLRPYLRSLDNLKAWSLRHESGR